MVELQIICKIIQSRSLTILRENNLGEDHFTVFVNEIRYILHHQQTYGNVPDVLTFAKEFPDFRMEEVYESDRYLVETLQEQYMFKTLVPFVHELADVVTKDSKKAVEFLVQKTDEITKLAAQYKQGYDIIKNAPDRQQEVENRINREGLMGIQTGIKELDDITHGWLKEDFIVIVGRTNEGKSWVLLFFLVAAWAAGVPVLLYSGEMSELIVGFRFDTLNAHFSNRSIMSGNHNLGSHNDPKTLADYSDYVKDLSTTDVPFIVVTPKHLGGKRLDIPTLHMLIEMYKPGIVGVDQLSLMDDYRAAKGEIQRIRYTHISEDLFLTSEKYQIPIIAPVQANREAKKKGKEATGDETPELEHIAESDGVPQNATRVIGIKQLGPTMKMGVKKNRYGENNKEILQIWDIDKGIVKPFLTVSTDEHGVVDAEEEQRATVKTGVNLF